MGELGCFRECTNEKCGFRFPDRSSEIVDIPCPKCGYQAKISNKVFENQLSVSAPKMKQDIVVFLDNIRSVYNVGSIFRTCDGLGITKMVLTGITPTPDHPRIQKTSLGATIGINWDYHASNLNAIRELRFRGYELIALEKNTKSLDIYEVDISYLNPPLCLIIGNENLGIDPAILEICDLQIGIPMAGFKESFNVSVAFGIAAFYFGILLRISSSNGSKL